MIRGFGVVAVLTLALASAAWPAAAQQTGEGTPAPVESDPARVGDIVVQGRLEERARQFTEAASGPPHSRGLARWRGPACIGVYNFRREVGEQLADGLARSGAALNVPIADGPCEPNIMIIGAVDSRAIASQWVERERWEFRPRISGAASPQEKLDYFTTADVPVRWWAISRPAYFDIFRGRRILAGGPRREPIEVRTAMNRGKHTRDDLQRIIVILDVDRIAGVSAESLIAYLTMVSFTQVDMQAEVGDFHTILNLFDPGRAVTGLTEWDEAYVRGLYDVSRDLRIEDALQAERMAVHLRDDAAP